MAVKSELLFFFSALGAFNGLILSLYFLFFARPKHSSNVFLGGFLLSLSIRTGKSVFLYFIPDIAMEFRQLGLTGCLFIGPFLYLYFRSINRSQIPKDALWKVLLIVLSSVVLIGSVFYPYKGNVELWDTYIVKNIYHLWLVFSLFAGYELSSYLQGEKKVTPFFSQFNIWLISIYVGNTLIWLSYYFVGWGSYILGALLFSFMFYILVFLLTSKNKKKSILLKTQKSYQAKKIGSEKATELMTRLDQLMEEEKLFINPSLKLPEVAKRLNVLPHTLSQLLNDNMKMGFPKYINQWRIKEAKHLIVSKKDLKLDAISYECGFNSTSTFYSTFKRMEGLTPSKYRELRS